MVFDTCSAGANVGWGFYDEGGIGNTYVGCHAEGNTGEGTYESVAWGYSIDARNHDYYTAVPSVNASLFLNCYTESAINHLSEHAGAIAGLLSYSPLDATSAGFQLSAAGAMSAAQLIYKVNGDAAATQIAIGGGPSNRDRAFIISRLTSSVESERTYLDYDSGLGWWDLLNGSNYRSVMRLPTIANDPRSTGPWFVNGLFLGEGNTNNTQLLMLAAPAPVAVQPAGNARSYAVGDIVWQSAPAAGDELGQRCVTAGTQGTLNGGITTATATSGSPTVIVDDYTGLERGQWITIAGVTSARQIDTVVGTTVTLTSNADASVGPGAAVAFSNAVFETIVNARRPSVAVSAYEIDWSAGDVFTKTLGAGAQVFTFANAADGMSINVIVTGSASTLTWPTVTWLNGGVSPTQTASGTDVYTFIKAGSTIYGNQAPA